SADDDVAVDVDCRLARGDTRLFAGDLEGAPSAIVDERLEPRISGAAVRVEDLCDELDADVTPCPFQLHGIPAGDLRNGLGIDARDGRAIWRRLPVAHHQPERSPEHHGEKAEAEA